MSDEIIQQARQLIINKQYDDARIKLEQISDSPIAQKWLTKLDEIAPKRDVFTAFDEEDIFSEPVFEPEKPKSDTSKPSIGELASRILGNKDDSELISNDVNMIVKADKVTQDNDESSYSNLQLIMNLYKIAGALMLAVTILGSALIFSQLLNTGNYYYQPSPGTIVGSAFAFLVGGIITSASLYAVGELIHIIISIERNVRISAQLQASSFKQLLELNHNINKSK